MNMPARWNSLKTLPRVDGSDFDAFLRSFGLRPVFANADMSPEIRIDVTENDAAYEINADLPGVKKEDIDIAIDGNQVTITAEARRESSKKDGDREVHSERYFGQTSRSFSLSGDVDDSKAEARYQNGVLSLHLPKKADSQRRRIKVD